MQDTRIIDSEFAFVGPMGFDLGSIVAHLIISLFACEAHLARAGEPTTACEVEAAGGVGVENGEAGAGVGVGAGAPVDADSHTDSVSSVAVAASQDGLSLQAVWLREVVSKVSAAEGSVVNRCASICICDAPNWGGDSCGQAFRPAFPRNGMVPSAGLVRCSLPLSKAAPRAAERFRTSSCLACSKTQWVRTQPVMASVCGRATRLDSSLVVRRACV